MFQEVAAPALTVGRTLSLLPVSQKTWVPKVSWMLTPALNLSSGRHWTPASSPTPQALWSSSVR